MRPHEEEGVDGEKANEARLEPRGGEGGADGGEQRAVGLRDTIAPDVAEVRCELRRGVRDVRGEDSTAARCVASRRRLELGEARCAARHGGPRLGARVGPHHFRERKGGADAAR